MNSLLDPSFVEEFGRLPTEVRERAKKAYALWKQDSSHPSLHFKRVSPEREIYFVRVERRCRGLGTKQGDTMVWFFIGTHAEYEQRLS